MPWHGHRDGPPTCCFEGVVFLRDDYDELLDCAIADGSSLVDSEYAWGVVRQRVRKEARPTDLTLHMTAIVPGQAPSAPPRDNTNADEDEKTVSGSAGKDASSSGAVAAEEEEQKSRDVGNEMSLLALVTAAGAMYAW